MLQVYIEYKQNNWNNYLPMAKFAYNNAKQMSIGLTLFELDYGQIPNMPLQLTTRDIDNVSTANNFIQEQDNKIAIAKDALLEAQR